jgi:hypothetical protein
MRTLAAAAAPATTFSEEEAGPKVVQGGEVGRYRYRYVPVPVLCIGVSIDALKKKCDVFAFLASK